MRKPAVAVLVVAFALCGAGVAQAGVILLEDFNAGTTSGSALAVQQFYSERWANTDYYAIDAVAGWSFGGNIPLLAVNRDELGEKALLLNEPSAFAIRTLTGLDPTAVYTLTFNLSGDNRPGSNYVFRLDVNGLNALNVTSSWVVHSGGTVQTVYFSPDATGIAQLKFYQNSSTQASPIIDDLVVTVPDGGASLTLLGAALMAIGLVRRKFRG